jgi:hypothetical protein
MQFDVIASLLWHVAIRQLNGGMETCIAMAAQASVNTAKLASLLTTHRMPELVRTSAATTNHKP